MGPASGRLRGIGRRGSAAGVFAVVAIALLPALPAAGGEGGPPAAKNPAPGPPAEQPGKRGSAPGQAAKPAKHAPESESESEPAQAAPAPEPATSAAPTSISTERSAGRSGQQSSGARQGARSRARSIPPAAEEAVVQPPSGTASTPESLPPPRAVRTRAAVVRRTPRERPVTRAAPRVRVADSWVPAPSTPAPTPAPPPAGSEDSTPPGVSAPAERGQAVRKDTAGAIPLVPIVVNALSESVAFVPLGVWMTLGALALLAILTLGFAVVRDRHARRLTRERAALIADIETLEGAVVPALPEALGGLALSVSNTPATGPAAGGDFHDAFPLSRDRVAVIIGDVAGQGRQVLADAQLVRHAVRAYLEAGLDPRSAIAMTGSVVDEREERLFASVLVAVHDRRDGTLVFSSAGHEPPILVGEHGAGLPPVPGWSPPLGTGLETGRRQTQLPLAEGSAVCLVTDGVTEARSQGERMGASRVIKWLSALGPGAMSSDVVARLEQEADISGDDVTVCMLRALTSAAPSVPRIEEAVVEGGDPTYLVRFLRDCGLPLADAEEAGEALAAAPDGTRMIASVEIRGGRAVVELAPLRGTATETLVG